MKRTKRSIAALAAVMLLMAGCAGAAADTDSAAESAASADAQDSDSGTASAVNPEAFVSTSVLDTEDMFTDRDYRTDYEDSSSVLITLSGDDASCDSSAVSISGGSITITQEGTYVVSGTLTDGTIIIDVTDNEKVWLVLNGVSIASADFASIYVINADKVFLTLADGSDNTLTNGGSFAAIDDNDVDAVIFSKDDLTINGSGSLTIDSPAGHGIVSKDDLAITGGSFTVTAGDGHCLSANDSIRIAAGVFTLTSSKDGIHAENDEDSDKGFVYICGGEITITSDGDGTSSSGETLITDGILTITAGGGSTSASDSAFVSEMQQRMQGGAYTGSSSQSTDDSSEDSSSCKGIKASGLLSISDGTLVIDSADDSVHANSDLLISSGTLTLASGDDGIHADETLAVLGGTITILESYEGLEGMNVYVCGGMLSIDSSDDGINAAGGTDESGYSGWRQDDRFGTSSSSNDYAIDISGGTITITAGGDGLDSNGSLTISGGETYISGPTDSANGAVDYTTTGEITGGILIAAGSSMMAQNMTAAAQGCVLISTGSQSACSVSISDSTGNILASCTVTKTFSSVLISCPGLAAGETYTLSLGDTDTQITLSSTICSVSTGSSSAGGQSRIR